jgi:hypothetical protein
MVDFERLSEEMRKGRLPPEIRRRVIRHAVSARYHLRMLGLPVPEVLECFRFQRQVRPLAEELKEVLDGGCRPGSK